MKSKMSPAAFSVFFCIAYMALFSLNTPPLLYFPVVHRWVWHGVAPPPPPHPGPAIAWYGLLAGAAVVAAVASLVIRDRWLMAVSRGWLWAWPAAAVAGCVVLLHSFFLT